MMNSPPPRLRPPILEKRLRPPRARERMAFSSASSNPSSLSSKSHRCRMGGGVRSGTNGRSGACVTGSSADVVAVKRCNFAILRQDDYKEVVSKKQERELQIQEREARRHAPRSVMRRIGVPRPFA